MPTEQPISEEIADLISQLIAPIDLPDPELLELADLARKTVHPQFKLASLVERSVAFHYGNMPSLIRLEVERLFRSGKIRFLVCTSTLIEGVNLSCRTIVLRGPRKEIGHPMGPHHFWNLAGRAGRWGDEFQGNIICIDPQDTKAWPIGVPMRSRYPIKRESDAIIELGDGLADYLDRRATAALPELKRALINSSRWVRICSRPTCGLARSRKRRLRSAMIPRRLRSSTSASPRSLVRSTSGLTLPVGIPA